MDVTIPEWHTVELRSDGAFAVWTVREDNSLGEIVGPKSSTDRFASFRAHGREVRLRVVHKDPVSVVPRYIDRGSDMEEVDPVPVELPFARPKSMQQRVDEMVRLALERQAEREGFESPEEAMDFDVDEDPEILSKYELSDMQDEEPISDLINDLGDGSGHVKDHESVPAGDVRERGDGDVRRKSDGKHEEPSGDAAGNDGGDDSGKIRKEE